MVKLNNWKKQEFATFQSLIGVCVNCNINSAEVGYTEKSEFQSLIGVCVNCNRAIANFRYSLRTGKVSIPDRGLC